MQEQVLGLINPAIALLFAACFAFLWLRNTSVRYPLALAAGYFLLATGFTIFHFMPDPNGIVQVLTMHAAYCGAATAVVWGIAERAGVAIRWQAALGIAVISGIAIAASTYAPTHLPRIFAANSTYGLIYALGTQLLSRCGRRDAIDRLILWLLALIALQFFVRPYTTFPFESELTAAEYRESVYYAATIVTVAVVSLMLAMALVAACVVDQIRALKAETERDALTGLLVRKAFEEEAVSLLDRAHAQGVPICAIVADIDHFKQVNDIWGHQAGDNGIASFGRLMADMVRDTDPIGRIGGEEFCIMVWNCEEGAAGRLAERIRASFAEVRVDGIQDDVHLTASFGVAQWRHGEGYGKLFARADGALYAAKDGGRDRVCIAGTGRGTGTAAPASAAA